MSDDLPELVKRVLKKMAQKIARQNRFVLGDLREAQKDIFQAGCLGYWVYRNEPYFPIKSIRYYMLNELASICWESSWQGPKTRKRLLPISLEHVNESRLPQVEIADHVDRILNYKRLIEAAQMSDRGGVKSGQRTKHMRTLRLFAQYGLSRTNGPSGMKRDTYWYACKSLEKFALQMRS